MKVKSEREVSQSCLTLRDPMDCSLPAPPSVGFARQEYWSGLPSPPRKYQSAFYLPILDISYKWNHTHVAFCILTQGSNLCFLVSPAQAGGFVSTSATWDTKGTFHAKMGTIKDRNGMDLTEAEDIKKRWQEYTEELYKKDLHNPDSHYGVITHLESDILECEVGLPKHHYEQS